MNVKLEFSTAIIKLITVICTVTFCTLVYLH